MSAVLLPSNVLLKNGTKHVLASDVAVSEGKIMELPSPQRTDQAVGMVAFWDLLKFIVYGWGGGRGSGSYRFPL